jgi:hypothetical protein
MATELQLLTSVISPHYAGCVTLGYVVLHITSVQEEKYLRFIYTDLTHYP